MIVAELAFGEGKNFSRAFPDFTHETGPGG